MKLITDIDGVLLDMLAPVRDLYGVDDREVVQWGLQEVLGIDDEEHERMWEHIWATPLSPYPGAMDFLAAVKKLGKVRGLSQRNFGPAAGAAFRDFPQLIILYSLVKTFLGKQRLLRMRSWDFYLEDCLLNAIRAGAEFGKDKVLLLDRPWNQSLDLGSCYTRVDGYDAVLEIVR